MNQLSFTKMIKDIQVKFRGNRGQAAMEYMTMIGLSLLILMGLLVVVNYMTTSANEQMNMNTAHDTVNKLKEAADFVYIHGHPTKITVYADIPNNLAESNDSTYLGSPGNLQGKTINLGMVTGSDVNDIYAVTKGNIAGDLPKTKGYYVFIVQSTGEGIDSSINITRI